MEDKLFETVSWGKYVYRSEIERVNFYQNVENDDSGIRYFIYSSQWLASLYVVIEGWESLTIPDERIDKLLSAYGDYLLTVKRCRNAVYHYQKSILDKRVEKAVSDADLLNWAGALLEEFVRFLFMYPITLHGLCDESLHLQKEYFDLIGWIPENESVVKWLQVLVDITEYYQGGNAELLKRSPENDKIFEEIFQKLKTSEINPYISLLSRL
ncbi:MAG: hypothetical protein MJK11_20870 [Pseudomonadales bacterium]|uniref:hypothetical protein n=1 Tax=Moritella sp. TaxID=78556 RepID=UPI001DEB28CF|nr:hypothetical protein [Moritella sp.]MCJ8315408.1 hypothetical protein [Pseudomonadales bacterium]NQZ52479.1 hypothetical protein [Moritella sp.]